MAPASAARYMLRIWILLSGVSRTQRTRGRFSLSETSAARSISCGGDAVGDAGQSADAARDDDHGVSGIRTAGHVGSDVGVRLHLDFARCPVGGSTQNLADEIGSAFQSEFFGHNAQGAVGRDEIHRFDALRRASTASRKCRRKMAPLAPVVATVRF